MEKPAGLLAVVSMVRSYLHQQLPHRYNLHLNEETMQELQNQIQYEKQVIQTVLSEYDQKRYSLPRHI